ncbi:hypothetical protein BP6252_00509 [Coleophoma cylindrospora]|uniref:Uncharacterized protein n=1 Tax=Coleophoma cylindrospora TaxID=1849047 RepID=A0A3D8SQA4_9HELO|nr:hypothetical protein BP6252_00509 [Coleophoma cylindrospora]
MPPPRQLILAQECGFLGMLLAAEEQDLSSDFKLEKFQSLILKSQSVPVQDFPALTSLLDWTFTSSSPVSSARFHANYLFRIHLGAIQAAPKKVIYISCAKFLERACDAAEDECPKASSTAESTSTKPCDPAEDDNCSKPTKSSTTTASITSLSVTTTSTSNQLTSSTSTAGMDNTTSSTTSAQRTSRVFSSMSSLPPTSSPPTITVAPDAAAASMALTHPLGLSARTQAIIVILALLGFIIIVPTMFYFIRRSYLRQQMRKKENGSQPPSPGYRASYFRGMRSENLPPASQNEPEIKGAATSMTQTGILPPTLLPARRGRANLLENMKREGPLADQNTGITPLVRSNNASESLQGDPFADPIRIENLVARTSMVEDMIPYSIVPSKILRPSQLQEKLAPLTMISPDMAVSMDMEALQYNTASGRIEYPESPFSKDFRDSLNTAQQRSDARQSKILRDEKMPVDISPGGRWSGPFTTEASGIIDSDTSGRRYKTPMSWVKDQAGRLNPDTTLEPITMPSTAYPGSDRPDIIGTAI